MKRILGILLALAMLAGPFVIPALASSEEPEEELITPGIRYYASVTVEDSSTGGSFYLYTPEKIHDYDMNSGFLNGLIFVYPDRPVSSEAEAMAFLEAAGLIAIADSFPAFVAMPLPLNGERYTQADIDVYDEIQFYLGAAAREPRDNGGGRPDMAETDGAASGEASGEASAMPMEALEMPVAFINGEHVFAVAEGSGATFVNNILSRKADRLAGIVTFGGSMDEGLPVGIAVPSYLVNADETAAAYWKDANGVTARHNNTYYNERNPLKQVIVADGGDSIDRGQLAEAWEILRRAENMKTNTHHDLEHYYEDRVLMRWPILDEMPLSVDSFDFDPSTGEAFYYDEKRTMSGNSVHVYVPDEVRDALDGSFPVVFVLHGASGDPIEMVESTGWPELAVSEHILLVAPVNETAEYVAALLDYILENYPADASRVYCTGFSAGGVSTAAVGKTYPSRFAAIAPMGSAGGQTVDGFDADTYDLPVCMIVGAADDLNVNIDENGIRKVVGLDANALLQNFAINELPVEEQDYILTPYWGIPADDYETFTYHEMTYEISRYYSDRYEEPIIEGVVILDLIHSYTDHMARLAWDFMSHFSRLPDGGLLTDGDGSRFPYEAD